MYARVNLLNGRKDTPLLIPGDALIVRGEGTMVATVSGDTVHLRKIEIGRDYGDRLEVRSGLEDGDLVIPNAADSAREGLKVEVVRSGAK
jgi:multidrug efflux pump subunit AcrA (membrane-fusion protein)